MASNDTLSPGEHTFSPSEGRVLECLVRGDGPLLIVLPPAWGTTSLYLQDGLSPLEAHFKLVYLEFRGNGKSTRPADPDQMSNWFCADDVEALRMHLGLDQIPRMTGHSNGGAIALHYAIKYPERVQKLLLLCHALEGFDDSAAKRTILEKRLADPKMMGPMQAFLMDKEDLTDKENGDRFREMLPVYFHVPEKTIARLPSPFPAEIPVWNGMMIYGKDRGHTKRSQGPELGRVKAKTLMIFGAEDPVCTPTAARATQKGIRGSELIVYEACGHFPWLESQETFFKDVVGFFA